LNQGDSHLDSYKVTPRGEAISNKASFNLQVVAVDAKARIAAPEAWQPGHGE
jgi:hypothetical protein